MHKPPHTIIRRAALLAAASAALAAPAAASAAPDFTPASTVDGTIDARVGFAHGEETRAHWELLSQNPPDTRVVVSTRNAGGSFADQLTIPSGGGFLPTTSRLVVAPNGPPR